MKIRAVGITVAVVFALAVGYWLVSPLWRSSTLDEALPATVTAEREVETLAQGSFVGDAHEVTGTARVVATSTGQVLRFEDFDTLNGPDLRIYLATDATAEDFVDLGELKATSGNFNYEIPEGTDVGTYDTVLVWCRAFSVNFGFATLTNP